MKVYVKRSWRVNSSQERVYHTDENCQYLQKGVRGRFIEKELDNLVDVRECKECAGESKRKGQGDMTLNKIAESADPEDFGLSPMGDR